MADNSLFPTLASMLPANGGAPGVTQFTPQALANPGALMQGQNPPLSVGPVSLPGAQQSGMQGVMAANQLQQMQTLQQQQQTQAAQQQLQLQQASKDADLSDQRRDYVKAMLGQTMNLTDIAGGAMKDKLLSEMSSDELQQHMNEAQQANLNQSVSAKYIQSLQAMGATSIPPGMSDTVHQGYQKETGTALPDNDNDAYNVLRFGALQAQANANNPNSALATYNKLKEIQTQNAGQAAVANIQGQTQKSVSQGAQAAETGRQESKLAAEPVTMATRLRQQFLDTGGEGMSPNALGEVGDQYRREAVTAAAQSKDVMSTAMVKMDPDSPEFQKGLQSIYARFGATQLPKVIAAQQKAQALQDAKKAGTPAPTGGAAGGGGAQAQYDAARAKATTPAQIARVNAVGTQQGVKITP
jgi:hypothetical protein